MSLQEINPDWRIFIGELNQKFFSSTGYGVHAHMSYKAILVSFKQMQREQIGRREFIRKIVVKHS